MNRKSRSSLLERNFAGTSRGTRIRSVAHNKGLPRLSMSVAPDIGWVLVPAAGNETPQ